MSRSKDDILLALEQARDQVRDLERQLEAELVDPLPSAHPASKAGRPSDSRFAKVIEASPVPYALNDERMNITYLNPSFVRTFGYDRSDIPTLEDWWPKAYPSPEYRKWVAATWAERLQRAKREDRPFEPMELTIRCKDGSDRTVLVSTAALEEHYAGEHLVILFDITERKRMEKVLQEHERLMTAVFDHLPSVVFVKEASDLRYVRFNAVGEEFMGLTRDDLVGKNDFDLFPEEQAKAFIAHDRAVLESGELEDIPIEEVNSPRGLRHMHTRKVAIVGSDGAPKYLLGISDDITDQLRVEAERDRLRQERHQANKMESLGQLAGGIAHDINNVLAIIMGYGDLALHSLRKGGDPLLIEGIEHIIQASERARDLIAQMLAFSRNQSLDNEPVQLADFLKENVRLLRATLPSSIDIVTEVGDAVPMVMLNQTHLHQLLMNLAVNGRDAMDGSGTLTIGLRYARDVHEICSASHGPVTGSWTELFVRDTGSGIDPAVLNDIFTPFYTSKPVGQGTGMGLSVVYGIMKSLHGHILVETDMGKGTVFRLLFPPLDGDVAASSEPDPAGVVEDIKPQGLQSILIVDDEVAIAKLLRLTMESNGYTACSYSDSKAALDAFLADPDAYSMVISDQTMPGLSGLEFIERARQVRPDLPVILCSGYTDKVTPEVLATPKLQFLKKPVLADTLLSTVEKLLA